MASRKMEKVIERLIDEYGNEILRIAYVYLKDQQLAEDAFQEVFLKVYMNYNSFRKESSEKTWIIRITINVCKDMLKSSYHQRVQATDDEVLTQIHSEDEDFLERLSNKELFETILKLDPKYKDVIILYYYQGFKIKEMASLLDTTTGQVSSLLARARENLKQLLGEEEVIR